MTESKRTPSADDEAPFKERDHARADAAAARDLRPQRRVPDPEVSRIVRSVSCLNLIISSVEKRNPGRLEAAAAFRRQRRARERGKLQLGHLPLPYPGRKAPCNCQ